MEEIFNHKFRFTDEVDVHLAREVYGQNPYEDPKRWPLIQINMLQITGRSTLKDRIQLLVKKYLAKCKSNRGKFQIQISAPYFVPRGPTVQLLSVCSVSEVEEQASKSGIEEIVTELDDLLQQIVDIIKKFKNVKTCDMPRKPGTMQSKKSSFQKGFDFRETCVTDISEAFTSTAGNLVLDYEVPCELFQTIEIENEPPSSSTHVKKSETPPERKRTYVNKKEYTVQYLTKKNDKQYEIGCRELDLQERKLKLEEKKFTFESEERRNRFQIEQRRLELEEIRLKIQLENLRIKVNR